MRWSVGLASMLVLVAVAASARADLQDQDPAELMPPQTMAYLELHQAGQTAHELAKLLKGTPLEDLLASFAKLQADHPDNPVRWDHLLDPEFSLLISPEAFGEAGRLHSGALGFLGFNKKDEPEFLGVLLTGDSHLPAFALRVYQISMLDGRVREVGRVGGVPLLQGYEKAAEKEGKAEAPEAREEYIASGPVFAYTKGLIVVGSHKDHVRDAVARFQGKSAGPTLAGRDGFRAAAKLRERPGLFAYVDVAAAAEEIDRHHGEPLSEYEWKLIKRLVNPKAARTLAANLTLYKGELALRLQLQIDPGQKSPLLELLAEQSVTLDHFGAVPGDSLGALTVRLSAGERLWDQAVALADDFAKDTGTPVEVRPSLAIRQWEKDNQLAVGKLLAKVEAVTLAYHGPHKLGTGKERGESHEVAIHLDDPSAEPASEPDEEPAPLLIVQARSEADAKDLEQQLPALLSCLGTKGQRPSQQKVLDHTVAGLKTDYFDGPVWYGRQGSRLVLGLKLESVARALKCAADGKSMAAQERVRQAFPKQSGTVLVGMLPIDTLVRPYLDELLGEEQADGAEKKEERKQQTNGKGDAVKEPDLREQVRELRRLLGEQPPLTLSVVREPRCLTLEIRPVAVQTLANKTIAALFAAAVDEKEQVRPAVAPAVAPAAGAAGGAPMAPNAAPAPAGVPTVPKPADAPKPEPPVLPAPLPIEGKP